MGSAKNTRKKKMPLGVLILFTAGLLVLLYPLISRTYYDYRGNEEITSFAEEMTKIPTSEMRERLQLGHAYNNALLSSETMPLGDPFSDAEKVEGVAAYATSLEVGEKLGVLTIPKINMKFPIYAGTNESVLQKGVGHMEGTSLPIGGLNTHSVVTAHRGLPENKLFTDLDQMAIDDLFFVETIAGELAYKVIEIKVIEPTEIEALRIEPNRDLVTLLTCTPYMINSHRLLVVGERTELPAETQKEATEISWWAQLFSVLNEYVWLGAFILLLILVKVGGKIWRARGRD